MFATRQKNQHKHTGLVKYFTSLVVFLTFSHRIHVIKNIAGHFLNVVPKCSGKMGKSCSIDYQDGQDLNIELYHIFLNFLGLPS